MFHLGVDYYPEQWPEERWPEDARMMAEAGVNVVRLAEFAWSRLESRPGQFDFDWLDGVLELLGQHDIRAVLGTPTASPPPWVMDMMPGAYRVLESGQRQTYGNRREYCPTHPGYRERCRAITEAMAEHYTEHPTVIGWQIDNELGGRCYCPICRASFQSWLERKYGSIERVNGAWGTAFWSHVYTEWSQIPVPLQAGGVPNPGLDLDYRRFMSDVYVSFQQEQVDVLRRLCPGQFVTHNMMGFGFDQIDYFDLADTLDFVGWDVYPRTAWSLDRHVDGLASALGGDTIRGLKGRGYWVMEQGSGSGGWQTVGGTPRPGEMRLWTYQSVAHGADGILYFRWRTAHHGAEQYWHGVLDHHGEPRRRYRELQTTGAELGRVGERFVGAESRARVAMLLSYDSRFAFQGQPNHSAFDYSEFFRSYYAALYRRNVPVDIVSPAADLSGYRLVLAPALHVLPAAVADNLRGYVGGGGALVVTARTGVKDESNAVVDVPLPGLLADVCGVEVEEYDALPTDAEVPLEVHWQRGSEEGCSASGRLWCEVLSTTTAREIATYEAEFYAGRAAITLNEFGKGKTLYVGTFGDAALHDLVVGWALEIADVSPVVVTPEGVEATERWRDDQRLLFLLNHADESQEITLPSPMTDLLSGRGPVERVKLEPKDVVILEQD